MIRTIFFAISGLILASQVAIGGPAIAILEEPEPAPVLSVEAAVSMLGLLQPDTLIAASCCKRCSKGKACGDSCIARDKRCHKGPGCACD